MIWPNDLQDFFFDLKRCGGKMIGPSKYGDMLKKLGWSSQPRKIVIQNPRKVKGKPVMKPRLVSSEKMRLWALADNPGGHAYRHVYRYHSSRQWQDGSLGNREDVGPRPARRSAELRPASVVRGTGGTK